MIPARHLEKLPVLQPEGGQPAAPDTARIQAQQVLFQVQAQRGPVAESDGDLPGFASAKFEPGFIGGWLRTRGPARDGQDFTVPVAETQPGQDIAYQAGRFGKIQVECIFLSSQVAELRVLSQDRS